MSTHPHSPLPWRAVLDRLVATLRELHSALIDVTRRDYETEHGPIGGAGNLLHLLMHDDAFAWLRPLSQLMADLDALLDLPGAVAHDDAAAARLEVELLLRTDEEGAIFAAPYFERLQIDPMVASEHGQLRKMLSELPASENHAAIKHKRKAWNEASRVPLRQHLAAKHKLGHKPS